MVCLACVAEVHVPGGGGEAIFTRGCYSERWLARVSSRISSIRTAPSKRACVEIFVMHRRFVRYELSLRIVAIPAFAMRTPERARVTWRRNYRGLAVETDDRGGCAEHCGCLRLPRRRMRRRVQHLWLRTSPSDNSPSLSGFSAPGHVRATRPRYCRLFVGRYIARMGLSSYLSVSLTTSTTIRSAGSLSIACLQHLSPPHLGVRLPFNRATSLLPCTYIPCTRMSRTSLISTPSDTMRALGHLSSSKRFGRSKDGVGCI